MRSRPASVIQILYDGDDITRHVLFAESTFETVAGAQPGQASVACKDPLQTLSFTTGKTMELVVDGETKWGGLVMNISRKHFFPAVDTRNPSTVRTRKWVLGCYDWNLYFDKRVLNDPDSGYVGRLHEPGGPLGGMVIYLFDHYIDAIPSLAIARKSDGGKVGAFDRHYPKGLFIGEGKLLRDQMNDLAQYGGAVWYIDPNRNLVFDTVEDSVWGYTFVDSHPNWVTTMGFREGEINQDGLQMVTDALVWGGSEYIPEDEDSVVFARYPDPPANTQTLPAVPAKAATEDTPAYPAIAEIHLTAEKEQEAIERLAQYGRWQRAEMHAGEDGYLEQESVDGRAYTIVAGPSGTDPGTGIDGGLNQPLWQVRLAWFAHDVPNQDHIRPGQLVDFTFYTMDNLSLRLPCRRFVISFPGLDPDGKAFVRFEGEFGISYTDPRFLWKFLFGRKRKVKQIASKLTSASLTSSRGDVGEFDVSESPNGSRTVFTIPFPYLSQTTSLYLNGLRQRRNLHYTESDPTTGEITFITAPESDDTIRVVCTTGDS